MKVSMVPRIVSWVGGGLMIMLVLQGMGLMPVLSGWTQGNGRPKDGVYMRTAPGAGASWKDIHDKYAADIDARDRDQGLQVVVYGDDVAESWRGSSAGKACPACNGVPTIWGQHFGSIYRAQSYGIAGEQTANLLWRLRHGGKPRRLVPAVTIVHTGAADMDAAFATAGPEGVQRAVPGIASRIDDIVKLLQDKSPSSRIIILGMLPRIPLSTSAAAESPSVTQQQHAAATSAESSPVSVKASVQPGSGGGPERSMLWPSQLGKGIINLNARLERLASKYASAHFVDCSPAFLQRSGHDQRSREIASSLMPDGRQPNDQGMHRLGLCLDSLLDFFIKGSDHAEANGEISASRPADIASSDKQASNADAFAGIAAAQDTIASEAVMAAAEQQKIMSSREATGGTRA